MTTRPAVTMTPGSLPDLIFTYLKRRKTKRFRCYQLAEALDKPTQQVARDCHRMWTRGQLDRERVFEGTSKAPTTYYRWRS